MTAPGPQSASAPAPRRRSPGPLAFCGCCFLLGLGAGGLYLLGQFLGSALQEQVLPGPEGQALGELFGELSDLAELSGPERDQRLRGILTKLVDSRRERASPEEQRLLDTLAGFAQEGASGPEQTTRLFETIQALKRSVQSGGSSRAPREAELFERLLDSLGEPAPGPADREPGPVAPAGAAGTPPAPGQWVILTTTRAGARGEADAVQHTYRWITDVDAELVTVRCQDLRTLEPMRALGEPYELFLPRRPLAPAGGKQVRVDVAGQEYRCFRVEETDRQGRDVSIWTTLELPVFFGLYVSVRQITRNAKGRELERVELVRYGAEGGGLRRAE